MLFFVAFGNSSRQPPTMAALASINRQEALERWERAKNRASALAAKTAAQADKLTGMAFGIAAAAGMGYYMAKSDDLDGQWFGFDKELWVTGILAAVAFWLGDKSDNASKMTANLALFSATAIGGAYAYGVAHQKVSGANPDFS